VIDHNYFTLTIIFTPASFNLYLAVKKYFKSVKRIYRQIFMTIKTYILGCVHSPRKHREIKKMNKNLKDIGWLNH